MWMTIPNRYLVPLTVMPDYTPRCMGEFILSFVTKTDEMSLGGSTDSVGFACLVHATIIYMRGQNWQLSLSLSDAPQAAVWVHISSNTVKMMSEMLTYLRTSLVSPRQTPRQLIGTGINAHITIDTFFRLTLSSTASVPMVDHTTQLHTDRRPVPWISKITLVHFGLSDLSFISRFCSEPLLQLAQANRFWGIFEWTHWGAEHNLAEQNKHMLKTKDGSYDVNWHPTGSSSKSVVSGHKTRWCLLQSQSLYYLD